MPSDILGIAACQPYGLYVDAWRSEFPQLLLHLRYFPGSATVRAIDYTLMGHSIETDIVIEWGRHRCSVH